MTYESDRRWMREVFNHEREYGEEIGALEPGFTVTMTDDGADDEGEGEGA